MGSFNDLLVRVGVEGIPAFKSAFKDAIEALETTGTRATQAGSAINRAFSNLGVTDQSTKIAVEAKKLEQSFALLERAQKEGKITAADFAKAQDGIRVSLERLGSGAEPIAAKLARIGEAFKGIGVSNSQFQIGGQIEKLKASLNELEKEYKEGAISAADFAKAQKVVGDEVNRLNKSDFTSGVERLQERLGNAATSAKNFGTAFSLSVTAPIVAFAGASIKAAADMESLEIGLRAVTKDAGPLEVQLKRLQEVAKLPGLGFKEAVQGSINLQAAGFSANTAERALKAFGNALATVGKGRVELDGVVTALSQIASKGKISAEEINQLAERLPQIRVAIKDAFGPGFTDAKAFEQAGITSEIFVEKIIAQFEKLPKAAGGFKNDMENLRDSAEQTLASFGKALLPFASSALQAVQPFINALQSMALEFAKMPQGMQTAIVGIAGLLAAIGPVSYAFGAVTTAVQALVPLLSAIATSVAPAGAALGAVSTSALVLTGALVALGAAATAFAVADAVSGAMELKEALDGVFGSAQQATEEIETNSVVMGRWGGDTKAANGAILDFGKSIDWLGRQLGTIVEYGKDNFWQYIFPPAALGQSFRDLALDIKVATGKFPELEAAARKLQHVTLDSARSQGQKAIDAYSGKGTEDAVKSNLDAIFKQKAANLQELQVAQETLKSLKAMRASKEELAAATIKVTEAQRKLHPELRATGNAAGGATAKADDLQSALSKLVKDDGANQFKSLNDALTTIEKAFAQGKVSLETREAAYRSYEETVSAVFRKEADAFNKLVKDADKAATDVANSFSKAAEQLRDGYEKQLKPVEITVQLKDRLGSDLFAKYEQAVKSARDLSTAFKTAGVSQAGLVEQADDLAEAYRVIASTVGRIGGATQGQADQARLRFLEAEIKAQRELNGDVQKYQEELTRLLGKINDIKSADDAYRNAGLETLTALQIEAERAAKAYAIIGQTGQDSAVRVLTAQQKALEAQREVAIATGGAWADVDDQLERVAERLKKATDLKGLTELQAAFRTFAITAGDAVTKSFETAFDALVKGDFKGVGQAFTSMWRGVADAAVKSFTEPLKNALAQFFGHTVRDLLKGSLSGIKEDIKDIAGVIKGLFSAGGKAISAGSDAAQAAAGIASATGQTAGAVASTGSAVAGAAGKAAGAAASGVTGIVTGVVSAVSAVISNFQFYAMNKSLDIIVKHTLQTANDLANLRDDSWTREGHLMAKLDDLAQFTWKKLDEIILAVIGIGERGQSTVSEGGTETVSSAILSDILVAVTGAGQSIVDAIKGMGTAVGDAAAATQTIVLRNAEEMSQFLAKLVQEQAAAFSALPVGIQQAIDAGKLSELVASQDEATRAAIAEYVRISQELSDVRGAVNSLKPVAEATAQSTQSSAVDLSRISTAITPTNGGFDTSSVLAGLANLGDRMAAYWDRLFEVLASGPAQIPTTANGNGQVRVDSGNSGSIEVSGLSGTGDRQSVIQRFNELQERFKQNQKIDDDEWRWLASQGLSLKASEHSTAMRDVAGSYASGVRDMILGYKFTEANAAAWQDRSAKFGGSVSVDSAFKEVLGSYSSGIRDVILGYKLTESDAAEFADRKARFGGSVTGGDSGNLVSAQIGAASGDAKAVADYYKYNYRSQYENTPERQAELQQMLNSRPPSVSTPSVNLPDWKSQQAEWQKMNVPTVDTWRGAWTGKSGGSGITTIQPIKITSQLVVDGRVLAESMATHNERMGYV